MKRILPLLLTFVLGFTSAQATILPAEGVDESFYNYTGIECTPAVVLCETLSIYDARGDQGGQKVAELNYTGGAIPVLQSWDGWAEISYLDATKTGWVRNEYLMMDPQWYLCDTDTKVYAYPYAMAPRVALLDAGTTLPILTEYEDGESVSGWVCVSLRGAAGWIRKTPADTVSETWFRPALLAEIVQADLILPDGRFVTMNDEEACAALALLLTSTNDTGGLMAGCPFTAQLNVCTASGQWIELEIATDSCCVYRVDGRDYQYARNLWSPDEGSPDNLELLKLFGLTGWGR